jgi:DNA-binding response OmpR family regulator
VATVNGASAASDAYVQVPVGGPAEAALRVMIVEDDAAIAEPLAIGLTRAGYEVERVERGAAAVTADPVDVILLDLGLPDMDGLSVCTLLRERSDAVIIVITARSEEADRVSALDLGADDYLVKPFGFAELLARIRANVRRSLPGAAAQLRAGPLVIDTRAREVTVAGSPVKLTAKEYDLLACLAEDPGRVYTRQQILEAAWDAHYYGPTKALDVHVASLRRKLGLPSLIQTVYGVGFRLDTTVGDGTPEPDSGGRSRK